ncbi:hypothetical protein Dthio_PD1322 [Desulfonatronospira thiodismutans ASO3-1]|uniref:Uncharacterized protein n=1 Tax=Desulfonatronospira thiodismutans ASO3-1 TaxID=555779 RepID=D6STG7_9BACT|nr:hypothetical protein Dthio_PD1322 [Desulfonatronospira thiodismutans ASO3-1]
MGLRYSGIGESRNWGIWGEGGVTPHQYVTIQGVPAIPTGNRLEAYSPAVSGRAARLSRETPSTHFNNFGFITSKQMEK